MFTPTKALLVCVIAGTVGAGAYTLRHHTQPANANIVAKNTAETLLSSLPAAESDSRTDREIRKWKASVTANPNSDKLWVSLGDALTQKARETLNVDIYETVKQVYQKAWVLNPKSAEAATGLAWATGARHDFKESVEWAKKAIALTPSDPAPYGIIGDAAVEWGDNELAFENYQKMLDLRPDISSYSRGAHLLYLAGDARKAMWLMGKAIKAGAPYGENTAWCRAQLAQMLMAEGETRAAEQLLTASLKLSPKNYHLLAAMGQVKSVQKEYSEAIRYYEQANAVTAQHATLAALEELYRVTGQPEKATAMDAKIAETNRHHSDHGIRGGDMQMARYLADRDRDLPEALKMAESEYTDHKSLAAMDTLAWCQFKNGNTAEAWTLMQKVLKHRVPDAAMLFHAGMIAAKQGDRTDAQRYLYGALSRTPNFSPTYAPVAADTLKQLGDARQTAQR